MVLQYYDKTLAPQASEDAPSSHRKLFDLQVGQHHEPARQFGRRRRTGDTLLRREQWPVSPLDSLLRGVRGGVEYGGELTVPHPRLEGNDWTAECSVESSLVARRQPKLTILKG